MNNARLLELGFELPESEMCQKYNEPLGLGKWLATAWVILPIIASGLGIGATVRTMEKAIAIDQSTPIVEPEQVTTRTSDVKIIKLTVNVSSPEDLKVKQGDTLRKDAVIADRDIERSRLVSQKNGLVNSIARLNIPSIPPLAPRPVARPIKLPSISYSEEIAEINAALLRTKAIEDKVSLQQRKLDVLGTLDEKDFPPVVAIHEQQKLLQFQAELDRVKAEQELAEGKLQTAKNNRGYEEYKYSEAIARFEQEQNQIRAGYDRALAEFRKQEQERTFAIATLDGKMAEVENQLKTLTTVRSPYNAQVRRIKLVGQNDNKLTYDLVLTVNGSGGTEGNRPDNTRNNKAVAE